MTLCVGALALAEPISDPRIVLATDFMLSTETIAGEGEWKCYVLSSDLLALCAGSPGRAKEWALICRDHLREAPPARSTVCESIRTTIEALKRRMAASYVGFRLGIPYDRFLREGPAMFGPDKFAQRIDAIERSRLRLELIIAGFVEGEPVLLRFADLDAAGGVEVEEVSHFCAIGVGQYDAYRSLLLRNHGRSDSLEHAVYRTYEAKRAGEGPGVGEKTQVIVLRHDDTRGTLVGPLGREGEIWVERLHKRYSPRTMKRHLDMPPEALSLFSPLTRRR
jgi:hypothetical protein